MEPPSYPRSGYNKKQLLTKNNKTMKQENEFFADAALRTKWNNDYNAYKTSFTTVSSIVVSEQKWTSAKDLRAKFLSDKPFEAGLITPIKQSEIESNKNGNKGEILLTFEHSKVGKVRMSLFEFKSACDAANVAGRDASGNLLAVNASNIDGKFVVIA
jgi:hypothetical protein